MRTKTTTDRPHLVVVSILMVMAILVLSTVSPFPVSAVQVEDRFVQLSNPRASEVSRYRVGFSITNTTTAIGSVRLEFCANDPIIDAPCTPPAGFDASGALLTSQAGATGFIIDSLSSSSEILLSRAPSVPAAGASVYVFDEIINPTLVGTFYLRIYTHASVDGTGPFVQAGGVALTTSRPVDIATEVPPYLTFCAGVQINGLDCSTANNFFIDFGEFSVSQPRFATSQLLAATNAPSGYNIRTNGTTLTSGNNVIPALGSPQFSQPGRSQFGLNLRQNGVPRVGSNPVGPGTAAPTADYSTPNRYKFLPNDVIVRSLIPSDTRKFTISYVANISTNQEPGIYTTTITFIGLANF